MFFSYILLLTVLCIFFFFKQKTAYEILASEWTSDVCSSDLRTFYDVIIQNFAGDIVERSSFEAQVDSSDIEKGTYPLDRKSVV